MKGRCSLIEKLFSRKKHHRLVQTRLEDCASGEVSRVVLGLVLENWQLPAFKRAFRVLVRDTVVGQLDVVAATLLASSIADRDGAPPFLEFPLCPAALLRLGPATPQQSQCTPPVRTVGPRERTSEAMAPCREKQRKPVIREKDQGQRLHPPHDQNPRMDSLPSL